MDKNQKKNRRLEWHDNEVTSTDVKYPLSIALDKKYIDVTK